MDFLISTKAPGAKIKPGVVQGWYIQKSELDTIATPIAVPLDQDDKVKIVSAHVPITDEGFREMYFSKRKSELKWISEGDEDSKSTLMQLDIFIPGLTAEQAAFLFDDPEMILLIPNGPCGTSEYIQMGTACEGAKISKFEGSTAKFGSSDAKGTALTITASQSNILLYTAAIPLPAED